MSKSNKTGGTLEHDEKFLMEKQAKHLYKEVNPTKGLSIKVTEQSLPEAENTYQNGILSDIDKNKNPKQMEEWSILVIM